MNTINVAEARESNGWCNIKTPEGKEISIKLDKCPKIVEQMNGKTPPYELTGTLVEKNGKSFLWDYEEKKGGAGGFSKASKGNESFALSYSKDIWQSMIAQGKDFTSDNCLQLADKFFNWLESKKK